MPEASREHPDTAPPPANPKGRVHLRHCLRIKPRPGHQPGLRFLLDLDANEPGRMVPFNPDALWAEPADRRPAKPNAIPGGAEIQRRRIFMAK